MGYFTFEENPSFAPFIKSVLRRRGLEPSDDRDWEVHGPHGSDFNYQVYIGSVRKLGSTEAGEISGPGWFMVAIYPHAVYWIEDASGWHKTGWRNRIHILPRERGTI